MIETGDCSAVMRRWVAEGVKVQMCVTSPPYWGLRDYGVSGQLGLESTPQDYVANMVEVFRLVRELLADDGTLWLNLGDSYAGSWGNSGSRPELDGKTQNQREKNGEYLPRGGWDNRRDRPASSYALPGLKSKDLVGIPWRVAFALQADGWYLRSDIIWAKPNPMPESVRDRCTKSHEYIFMLSKKAKYYYDADAIAEPVAATTVVRAKANNNAASRKDGGAATDQCGLTPEQQGKYYADIDAESTRNKRSVWTVTTKPFKGAHFATFPPDLIEPCILAGSRPGDTVLDPFGGSGTTGMVSAKHGRKFRLIDLNPEYVALTQKRIRTPLDGLL